MRKAIPVCGAVLIGLGIFLLLSGLSVIPNILPLGTRNQIAVAEHASSYGNLEFFLESGQNCILETATSAVRESAYIQVRQKQPYTTLLERTGIVACNGTFSMEFKAPATGEYYVAWDYLSSVHRIAVYRIEGFPKYAVLVADALVLVIGVMVLSLGISRN